jgi:hypothetical protein
MATIFGALGIADTDRVFNATQGQQAVYEIIAAELARYNAAMQAATGLFVGDMTENHTERYFLAGGSELQERGRQAPSGAMKASGSYDVAYPLRDYSAAVAGDDVAMAYMTAAQLQRHIQTVINSDRITRRKAILKSILNSSNETFVDELWGSLTVRRLANATSGSDTTTYPPVEGSTTEATEDHYLETGYAASAISDTNDPVVTGVDELEEHFGAVTGNSEIVMLANNAQTAKLQALTSFIDVPDHAIRVGTQTDVPAGLPTVPGKIIGRHTKGAWIVEWRWIPANYLVFVHLEVEAPLKERVDPADTGLGRGLQLVAKDAEFPFETSTWRDRFGYGVANRLNGVVLELGTGGTYSIPSGYS